MVLYWVIYSDDTNSNPVIGFNLNHTPIQDIIDGRNSATITNTSSFKVVINGPDVCSGKIISTCDVLYAIQCFQCDQMARLHAQYLAIYSKENLPDCVKKLPHYAKAGPYNSLLLSHGLSYSTLGL